MKLNKFRVTNFRSIQDSGWVECDDVTTLVGIKWIRKVKSPFGFVETAACTRRRNWHSPWHAGFKAKFPKK